MAGAGGCARHSAGVWPLFALSGRTAGDGGYPHALLDIAEQVKSVLQASPLMRTVNTDWGSQVPVMHFSLNQDRLQASGLSSQSVAQQLQFPTVRDPDHHRPEYSRRAGDRPRGGDIRLDRRKSPTSPR